MNIESKIAAFRAAVAARLGLGSSASNEQVFAELDRKRAATDAGDKLYSLAWPEQPNAAGYVSSDDEQLYAQAWGSTESGGR